MNQPRTYVVTGAGSGIGAAVAHRLADRGDRLLLTARSEQRIDDLVRDLPSYLHVGLVDLEDPAAAGAWARELLAGRPSIEHIDGVVHAAGVVDLGPVVSQPLVDVQRQLAVNLTSPIALTAGLLPALRAARGTVVFVNSGAGRVAHPEWSAYAASKFGLRAFADSLRAEEAPYGVRVSTVYPGRTATPMQAKVHEQEGKEYDEARWTKPETVADAILGVLDLGPDATISDLDIKPGPA